MQLLRAYRIWEKRKDKSNPEDAESDYFQACDHIDGMLFNSHIKASRNDFKEVKKYIENRYLTGGKTEYTKSNLVTLVRIKAHRIWEGTGETDEVNNWLLAEKYIKMFYENIIPAVMKKNCEEHILMVLKAFQFSKAHNCYHIINCFEKALAIYFLDQDIITELWTKLQWTPLPVSSHLEMSTGKQHDDTGENYFE